MERPHDLEIPSGRGDAIDGYGRLDKSTLVPVVDNSDSAIPEAVPWEYGKNEMPIARKDIRAANFGPIGEKKMRLGVDPSITPAAQPNTYVGATSKLSATNWTNPVDGTTHRFVFFQDPFNSMIVRRWNSTSGLWTTNNLTDIFSRTKNPVNVLTPSTPLASVSSSWFDRNELHIYYVAPDDVMTGAAIIDLVNKPDTWVYDDLGGATLTTFPGSQIAASWQRGYTSDSMGWWALAWQDKKNGAVRLANGTDFRNNKLAIPSVETAHGTSLALIPELYYNNNVNRLTMVSESLLSPTKGVIKKFTYQDLWYSDGRWLSKRNIPPPTDGVQFSLMRFDNWTLIYLLVLLPNGTITGEYFANGFKEVPTVTFADGPSDLNFTAIAGTEEASQPITTKTLSLTFDLVAWNMYISTFALGFFATLVATAPPFDSKQSVECTEQNALKRREWSALTENERKEYVSAMECLMKKPSRYAPGELPASDNYYTDFAAHHISVALNIHMSGIFLSAHRELLYLMEKSLHEKCGYSLDMGLPYWDWPEYLNKPLNESTLFDGSSSSLGGDGEHVQNQSAYVIGPEEAQKVKPVLKEGDTLPLGSGGGCVVEGPFANRTVYLGPFPITYSRAGLPEDWKEPNPHCFNRELSSTTLELLSNADAVKNLLDSTDITQFQARLNPIHRGGHLGVGGIGGQMADFFASPLDPAFWLHHAQIDRLWAIFQDQDPAERRYSYNGTGTFQNPAGTPEVTNSTVVPFGILGNDVTLEEVANPMEGRYCYRYV
ncbi:hypothetical protein GQX73_g2217 [Xylaria multiplex]|uniref:Tyrosinase copper-binding domain-containing protein n=1 Tax=Xylaria multiplex TaxID=323545 RepID=A0A7C8MWQ0_9PEZI|nr:hypothetical protein GQX73_g2217 [Xylaria multiplex]